MNRFDLIKTDKTIFRVLSIKEKILVIDCIKRTMPYWVDKLTGKTISEQDLQTETGVILPDIEELSPNLRRIACLQQTNTYMNRAVGFYLQKQGIPVIPNIRWGDESTYDFCFLGVPKNGLVCISTHGCLKTKKLREIFKAGIPVMLEQLTPHTVIVHGFMPEDVFGEYSHLATFFALSE